MLFNSFTFLLAFLPPVYAVFWWLRSRRWRYVWLTAASYVFYGFWDPRFCLLMLFSTLVSFLAGRRMARAATPGQRKLALVVPVVIDLSLLGFFKYTNFFLASVSQVANDVGMPMAVPYLNVVLPIGISFYTFHTISYMVDCYRRDIEPTDDFWEFSCYVSLFSQLVAGPIVRFRQIRADLEHIESSHRTAGLDVGWSFFVIGLAEKVLIADSIAAIVNPALAEWRSLSTASAWLVMLGYSYQLFFDFCGYSDMAVGLGWMFGLRIPQNFNSPYKSLDMSDFWRRWHISLSSCLRDYLYIPLGGNRKGPGRTYVNLFATMLLGGLWHGANWTFVVWGAYHGGLLAAQRRWGGAWARIPARAATAVTFVLVVVGWTFFRADDLAMAVGMLGKMFSFQGGAGVAALPGLLAMLAIAGVAAHVLPNTWEIKHDWGRAGTVALCALFAASLIVMYGGQQSPFLYFQF